MIIVSTLGQGGRVEIVQENTNPFIRITLGHFAEGHGEHYVTLEDLNEVSSESEVDITDIDDSAVENIEMNMKTIILKISGRKTSIWNSSRWKS